MEKKNFKIETFEFESWIVDIVTTDTNYEAWIYRSEYGVKMLMFGMPKEQQSYDEFIDIVEGNLETNEYQSMYLYDYCSDEFYNEE